MLRLVRSLITLMALVLVPMLTLLLWHGPYNPITVASNRLTESHVLSLYRGTFAMLDQELENLSPEDRRARFNEISDQFGMDLTLLPRVDAQLSSIESARLKTTNTILKYGEDNIIVHELLGTDQVILMQVEETEIDETYRQAQGSVFLIRSYLQRFPQRDWPDIVESLEVQHGFPIQLLAFTDFSEPENIVRRFSEAGIHWYEYGENIEIFLVEIGSSEQALLIGPIPDTADEELQLYILFFAIVLSLISLCLLMWLWPLWRNLRMMQTGALQFGDGHLNQRVKVGKLSIVSDLARSFNRMADSIQSLITANQQLTNAVAHDLRTPLARLRFAMEILETGDCSPEEEARYKRSITSSIDSLDYLINQTLVHSRYNRMPDIRNFSDACFTDILRDEVQQESQDYSHLSFEIDVSPELSTSTQFVDKNALRRALANLLSNSVKYASSRIRVSYHLGPCDTDSPKPLCLHLIVEDDGPGINPDDYERILKPFAQLENEERNPDMGHGLGLAIVNQIAKWHRGNVRIDRSPLGGALVELCLPVTASTTKPLLSQ